MGLKIKKMKLITFKRFKSHPFCYLFWRLVSAETESQVSQPCLKICWPIYYSFLFKLFFIDLLFICFLGRFWSSAKKCIFVCWFLIQSVIITICHHDCCSVPNQVVFDNVIFDIRHRSFFRELAFAFVINNWPYPMTYLGLSNIYDGSFLRKLLMAFSCQLFFQKSPS